MEEKNLVIIFIIALCIVVFLILLLVLTSMGRSKPVKRKVVKTVSTKEGSKKSSIEEMLDIVANRNSTKNDITNAIIKVSKEIPFPAKIKGKMPQGIKVYLNFVLLTASHKNADAKLIAFMNNELKKANKDYSTEIDIYENEGLRQRINRV